MKNKIEYVFKSDIYGGIEYHKNKVIIYLHKDLPFYASLYNWVKQHEESHAQHYFNNGKGVRRYNLIDLIDPFRIFLHPTVFIEFLLFWIFHPVLLLRWSWQELMFRVTGKEISPQNP